jgi:hypothetical protein
MITLLIASLLIQAPQTSDGYLYRTLLVRAAPGELLSLIELFQKQMPAFDEARETRPFMMRHSQGDQWDLLLLYPMHSFHDYYSSERSVRRERAARGVGLPAAELGAELDRLVAWQEELYVAGPPLDTVTAAFANASYFHVEMFIALPGMRKRLLEQRQMENAYLKAIDRPQNLIFTRVAGAAWDLYTIGFYRDIRHFAVSADVPADREDAAARAAGFEGADRIGTYLRSLIHSHHDTLARQIQ